MNEVAAHYSRYFLLFITSVLCPSFQKYNELDHCRSFARAQFHYNDWRP